MPPKRAAQPRAADQAGDASGPNGDSNSQAHTDDQIGDQDVVAPDAGTADQRLQPNQPSAAAPPPIRKPVQRLHSLYNRPSLSSTGVHSLNAPKALKYQPKTPLRRNQAEREAQDRAAAEKEAARIAQQPTPSIRQPSSFTTPANRNAQYIRGGGFGLARGRARGGTTNRPSRFSGGGATGHLGSFVARDGTKGASRGRGRAPTGTTATEGNDVTKDNEQRSTTSPSTKKKSAAVKVEGEGDKDGRGSRRSTTQSRRVKKEHSDVAPASTLPVEDEAEDTDASGRKLNIDFINLLSDDESHDTEGSVEGDTTQDAMKVDDPSRPSQRSQQHSFPSFRPVRLERQEHVDRPLADIVAGPSSSTYLSSAELRRRAKAKTDAEGSLFIDDDDDDDEVYERRRVKTARARGKGRDVEVLGRKKVWKGAWEDEDDEEGDRQVKIKEEPVEERGLQSDLEQRFPADDEEPANRSNDPSPSQGADPPQAPSNPHLEQQRSDEHPASPSSSSATSSSSDSEAPIGPTERQSRHRTSPFLPSRLTKPKFQTAEEEDEWQRYEQDLRLMNDILRSGQPPVSAMGSRTGVGKAQTSAAASDTKVVATAEEEMDLRDEETKKEDGKNIIKQGNVMSDAKAGRIYMLQLPPLLPAMELPKQKDTGTTIPVSSAPSPPRAEPNTSDPPPATATQPKKPSSSATSSPPFSSNKRGTRKPPATSSSSVPQTSAINPPVPTTNDKVPHPKPDLDPDPDPTPPPSTLTPLTSPTSLPAGHIGYLRMHASSRITLSWGNMLFSLNRNASDGPATGAANGGVGGGGQAKGGTLQEVVVMNYDDGREEGEKGEKVKGREIRSEGGFTVKVEEGEGKDGKPMEEVKSYGKGGGGDKDANTDADAMDVDDEETGAGRNAIKDIRADGASPTNGKRQDKGKQREEAVASRSNEEEGEEADEEDEDKDKNAAWAIGEINGGFVGVPEWEAMFS